MNPELPAPQRSPEQSVPQPMSPEYGQAFQTPERSGEQPSFEREQAPASAEQAPALQPPVIPTPLPVVVPVPSTLPAQDDAAMPTIANDDDLIEKEWVDKAKKIITDTRDDPYRREREVNRLQIDYLKKRYGKVLGEAD